MKTVRHIQVQMLVVTQKVNVELSLSVCLMIHVVKLLVLKADPQGIRNYQQGLGDILCINNSLRTSFLVWVIFMLNLEYFILSLST